MELYADYEPERLMSFLVSSQAYGLEAAAELCEHRGLVREQVFVLGRMGNARQALELIISKLADIPQVLHHRLQAPGAPHQCPSRSAGAWKGGSCSACEAQAVHAVCTASSVVAQPAGLEVCPAWNMAYVAALLTCACAMQAIEFVQMQRDDELCVVQGVLPARLFVAELGPVQRGGETVLLAVVARPLPEARFQ